MNANPRSDPLCGAIPIRNAFPWAGRFGREDCRYFACGGCGARNIDPVPSEAAMEVMYGSDEHHAEFYDGDRHAAYEESAERLAMHLPAASRVPDFDCGHGHLVEKLAHRDFIAHGAEFSAADAHRAAAKTGQTVLAISTAARRAAGPWDAIHLDVPQGFGQNGPLLHQEDLKYRHIPALPFFALSHSASNLGPAGNRPEP